jgi:hypothetical protein
LKGDKQITQIIKKGFAMIKKIALVVAAVAAISIPLAPVAMAQEDDPEPAPLSAEGLCGCDLPTLSVPGLLGLPETQFLSAQEILDRIRVVFGNGR